MKKLILLISLLIIGTSVSAKDFESQKFKTVFTITFNELTLKQASKIENVIKNKFKNACTIDVELDGLSSGDITLDYGNSIIIYDDWDDSELIINID